MKQIKTLLLGKDHCLISQKSEFFTLCSSPSAPCFLLFFCYIILFSGRFDLEFTFFPYSILVISRINDCALELSHHDFLRKVIRATEQGNAFRLGFIYELDK